MAYTRKIWADGQAGGTLITAAALNNLEQGVVDAHATATTHDETLQKHATALANLSTDLGNSLTMNTELTGLEAIAARLQLRSGSVTVAVASDSTANDVNDWVRVWLGLEAARRQKDLRIEFWRWDNAAQAYDPQLVQAGEGTPASGGTVLTDSFAAAGEVLGTTSTSGDVWQGTAGWSSDGATVTNSSTAGAAMSYDTGSRDTTITTDWLITTSKPAAAQTHRLYVGSPLNRLNGGVWASLSLSTMGALNVSIWKTIGGTSTTLVANTLTDLVMDSATAQTLKLALSVNVQNVSLKITTATSTKELTTQITEADYNALGTWSGVMAGAVLAPNLKLDTVTMATPYTPADYRTLKVLDAAVAGSTLAYQQSRLSTMFPRSVSIDALILSAGHNYGVQTPATFLEAVDAFVADYSALHPETVFLLSSQNPQFAPAASPAAHRARQAGARLHARRRGWDYLPAMEAFDAQPDGGAGLVSTDGVHPTTPPVGSTADGFGSTLWAQVMASHIAEREVTL